MRPVRVPGPRRRAAGVVLACLALAGSATFAEGGLRIGGPTTSGTASTPLNDGGTTGTTYDGGSALRGAHVPLDGAPDQAAADVLHVARNQVGDRYQWGGNGPDAWDCSGLTSLWGSVGGAKGMPRVSRDQQAWTIPVAPDDVKRGDLVFFGHPVTHVGIVSGGGYMIDAAESKKGVVHRLIWKTGVVRYGRVPRPGMPKVRPWTPPPLPAPQSDAPVADAPEKVATPRSAPAPSSGLTPLAGLPARQKELSSLVAYRAAAAARSRVGRAVSTATDDIGLVHVSWREAGGGRLPGDRAALVARGTRVALADARIGDVVAYDRPDTPHLGVYVGGGQMVDASPRHGRVLLRPVYAAGSVKLVRLTPAPTPRPAAAPAAQPPTSSGLPQLAGLPAKQKELSSLVAYRAAAAARSRVGRPVTKATDDIGLVHVSWRDGGGGRLPGSRDALAARGRAVTLADARIGDVVVYGRPATPHLGVYVGGGLMVDASPKAGRVLLRQVYAASNVRLVRLG